MPPLRERIDDLPALIDDSCGAASPSGRPSITFSETALDCLRRYRWPGNVRELQNLVERMPILYPNQDDRSRAAAAPIGERRRRAQLPVTTIPTDGGLDLREHLGNIEKQLIRSALDQTDGTVAHAARLLKLQRTTLVEKLRKYELIATAKSRRLARARRAVSVFAPPSVRRLSRRAAVNRLTLSRPPIATRCFSCDLTSGTVLALSAAEVHQCPTTRFAILRARSRRELEKAFGAFNRLSNELQSTYQVLRAARRAL